MQNVPVFEYDEPSRDNPALVLCIIDCSKSMRGSAAYQHAVAAITSLRKHARSKTKNIRLIVFFSFFSMTLSTSINLILSLFAINLPIVDFPTPIIPVKTRLLFKYNPN